MSEAASPCPVLVISSHVVRGAVGNRALVPALERFGHSVWALPTVVMPWHPGHGPSHRLVPERAAFSSMVDDLIAAPWAGEIGAVISGYLGEAEQVGDVARLVGALRRSRPDLVYLCDPVMGDFGGLYVPPQTARAIARDLMPLASIATPNRFELGFMAGAPLDDNSSVLAAALDLGPERVLVSSALGSNPAGTGSLLLTAREALLAEHGMVKNPPNGLGDLLSALFLARHLAGEPDATALKNATSSVFEIVARSVRRGADELTLASDRESLVKPMALVQMRVLTHPRGRR